MEFWLQHSEEDDEDDSDGDQVGETASSSNSSEDEGDDEDTEGNHLHLSRNIEEWYQSGVCLHRFRKEKREP